MFDFLRFKLEKSFYFLVCRLLPLHSQCCYLSCLACNCCVYSVLFKQTNCRYVSKWPVNSDHVTREREREREREKEFEEISVMLLKRLKYWCSMQKVRERGGEVTHVEAAGTAVISRCYCIFTCCFRPKWRPHQTLGQFSVTSARYWLATYSSISRTTQQK